MSKDSLVRASDVSWSGFSPWRWLPRLLLEVLAVAQPFKTSYSSFIHFSSSLLRVQGISFAEICCWDVLIRLMNAYSISDRDFQNFIEGTKVDIYKVGRLFWPLLLSFRCLWASLLSRQMYGLRGHRRFSFCWQFGFEALPMIKRPSENEESNRQPRNSTATGSGAFAHGKMSIWYY